MCTAIRIGSFVGRNLDIDWHYRTKIITTQRNYKFQFKRESPIDSHYAITGMGMINQNYPLYFDAFNECGLYAAGLNYVGYAKYRSFSNDKINLAPHELIPYVLSVCSTVEEAKIKLEKINLIDVPFSSEIPVTQLHFFIADKDHSIVAEPQEDGMYVYDNPTDVLTNNPSFPMQLFKLNDYMGLSPVQPENRLMKSTELKKYSNGMGAIGLPGDLSSSSRFIRAAFHKANCRGSCVADLFHLLCTVMMPDGSVKTDTGFERTEYSCGVDLSRHIYYYRHYDYINTSYVNMYEQGVDGDGLVSCKT